MTSPTDDRDADFDPALDKATQAAREVLDRWLTSTGAEMTLHADYAARVRCVREMLAAAVRAASAP